MMDSTIKYRAGIIANAYAPFLGKEMRVLDVGCGNGVVGAELAKRLGLAVTGTDIMPYVKTGIPFRRMESETTLPFPDGSFDAVMLNDMLHHMPYENQLPVIKEALRVSHLVLIFEPRPTLLAQTIDWVANKIHNLRMRITLTFRKQQEWENLLRREGIIFKTIPVKRPALYPIGNFLLILER